MVDPVDHGGIHIRIRRVGEEHLARPRRQMQLGIGPRAKHPGAIEHHIDSQRPPRQL